MSTFFKKILVFFIPNICFLNPKESSCMFMKEEDCDLWVMEMPMLIILAFNTFFLIWIISVNKNLPHSTS